MSFPRHFHHFSMNVFVFGPVLVSFDPTVVQTQDAAIRFLKAVGVDFERHKAEGLEGKLLGALLKGSASWPYEGIGGKGMNIEFLYVRLCNLCWEYSRTETCILDCFWHDKVQLSSFCSHQLLEDE